MVRQMTDRECWQAIHYWHDRRRLVYVKSRKCDDQVWYDHPKTSWKVSKKRKIYARQCWMQTSMFNKSSRQTAQSSCEGQHNRMHACDAALECLVWKKLWRNPSKCINGEKMHPRNYTLHNRRMRKRFQLTSACVTARERWGMQHNMWFLYWRT